MYFERLHRYGGPVKKKKRRNSYIQIISPKTRVTRPPSLATLVLHLISQIKEIARGQMFKITLKLTLNSELPAAGSREVIAGVYTDCITDGMQQQ